MNTKKIALFGLGKLGLPLALVLSKYYKVLGIDVDSKKIENLKNKISPFFEPQMNQYLEENIKNINFLNLEDYNIDDFDIAIILVNTPSNSVGEFSNNYIFDVVRDLSEKLKKSDKKDFLFILSSTVMPGSHFQIIEEIEKISGRKLNETFGFTYIPDLVALGNVINDFENPDLLIVGESNDKYGEVASELYYTFIKNNAPCVRMKLIEAEITKVSLNAYITMKISFANFIGNVSEKFNCNPNNITKALGYDRRISPYYIKSGLPFGGTCFPRDTWAFIKMSDNIGLDAVHIKASQKINEIQHENLLEKVKDYKDKKIGIFGLSFKPKTSVTTESAGHMLYENLKSRGYDVVACDELVDTDYTFENVLDFLNDAEVLVITHDDPLLKKNYDLFSEKTIINPWNIKFK